jgi:hypothetical protein
MLTSPAVTFPSGDDDNPVVREMRLVAREAVMRQAFDMLDQVLDIAGRPNLAEVEPAQFEAADRVMVRPESLTGTVVSAEDRDGERGVYVDLGERRIVWLPEHVLVRTYGNVPAPTDSARAEALAPIQAEPGERPDLFDGFDLYAGLPPAERAARIAAADQRRSALVVAGRRPDLVDPATGRRPSAGSA